MNDIKTFLFIDGHGLAYRAYSVAHSITEKTGREFSASDGTPTGMIHFFCQMLYRAQDDIKPDCTIITFDSGGKTFRHELLPDYKANREKSPENFKIQLPILKELLSYHGHKILTREGVEADDIIASLAKLAKNENDDAVILTSDKDFFQLLENHIRVSRVISGVTQAKIYDIEKFFEEYNFMPSSFADYLAITGDTVDNVKGVEGVGDVGAKKVLQKFPSLEKIFENLESIDTRTRNKFKKCGLEKAVWVRDNLIKLKDDIFNDEKNILDECLKFPPNFEEGLKLAGRLQLRSVIERIKKLMKNLEFNSRNAKIKIIEPECDLMTKDFKSELRTTPEIFTPDKKIWDLKTAFYMLHPDLIIPPRKSQKSEFQILIDEIENSQDPKKFLYDTALSIEGEIYSYDNLHKVMTEIDLPLIPVLNKMEDRGVRVDFEKFSAIQNELEAKILEIESEVINEAGVNINVNSPKQVSWLLFERLGYTPETKTKGKTSYSTDANVLEKLSKLPDGKGKIPALILEFRELMKMLTGFVIPFQKAADKNGIIHTTFEPASTGTGRLSSRDPNLQNIPAFGQWAEKIKSGLIPVNPENIFVAADYSQIELRVLAYMSGEEKLIDAFKNKRDIHTETASWVFDILPGLVTPELRRVAKMINFGLLYGMSQFGLSERLGISREEADGIMKKYFQALPGIQNFLDDIVDGAKARGYSRTLAGRIRPVNEIPVIGGAGALDRALINSPIQGTAADIARRAMINFEAQGRGKLFLQVHDSLVVECSENESGEIAEILSTIMKTSGNEIEHLEVQIKKGKSLSEV